ncbi:MAG: hypothetical protein E2581_29550 [Pseudomonas sp.]|uniref:hypothetical protein n=1 Tax=Pseudomonadota TaxID=1224 RepID=UPI0002FAA8A3|nr:MULTISPECIES: hypothetical protein [Pseudomonadota]MPT02578.1 hypothetical protein [Pseudomonas sp.]MPT51326.1 hypothetical protein [Delftia sp.]SFB52077.1 hypothetical protein SAMN05444579_10815 [Delftia tsuruhatensis]
MAELSYPTSLFQPTAVVGLGGRELYRGAYVVQRPGASQLDYVLGGNGLGRVRGRTVEQEDKNSPKVPVSRRVRLYRDLDGLLIRETWSNAQGEYDFPRIDSTTSYTVLSYDHEGDFRAVVADRVTPEDMP